MKYLLGIISLLLITGCERTSNKESVTYFGGQIVNPKSNFVLFLKDNKVIDTITLDKNNHFLTEYKSLKEGLYTFKHGIEFQYIYFEPSDSILVRLNSWDFDESMVFSGRGSSKNEFLLNLFLRNEHEDKLMRQFFSLNETEFSQKIETLTKQKEALFLDFKNNNENVSEGFTKLTNAAINYPLYRWKEIYPFYHKKLNQLSKISKISDSFYEFRKHINLNEENLLSFYPYRNYVTNYLYHISYKIKEEDSLRDNLTVNMLNLIVQNVNIEEFRNSLLKNIVVDEFLKRQSTCSINKETLNVFLKNCSNEEYKNEVQNLVNDSKYVLNNKPIKDFTIKSYDDRELSVKNIIENHKSVIYFWSSNYMDAEYLLKEIRYFEKRYPNILFIGVNMQSDLYNLSNSTNIGLIDYQKQFKLPENSYARKYLTSNYPRTIMVDEKGIVTNGFTHLDSKKFNSELIKLERK
ncbi:TlpA family protein disulfide reductase [Lutibacter citreus]|uniref:TlpA family protein disulfide reductase n=1 Tax=Lutibacter citreus TaxID=2138210 RepID=UPI000DBE05BA|nr:hypothetical protein [Lutibacter citreus]